MFLMEFVVFFVLVLGTFSFRGAHVSLFCFWFAIQFKVIQNKKKKCIFNYTKLQHVTSTTYLLRAWETMQHCRRDGLELKIVK